MFGMRLAELRKQKNLSQYKLAELLNVSRGQISNYEQGTRQPDITMLQKLATFFDVTVDYLVGHADEPSTAKTNDTPDLERPFRAKVLADAILIISALYFEYNLEKETFYQLIEKAVKKYGAPEPVIVTEPAAHGPNQPGTGAMNEEDNE